jgi:hypothetical protein
LSLVPTNRAGASQKLAPAPRLPFFWYPGKRVTPQKESLLVL